VGYLWPALLDGDGDGGLGSIAGFKSFKQRLVGHEIIVYGNNNVPGCEEFRRPSWSSEDSASHDIAFNVQTNLTRANQFVWLCGLKYKTVFACS
jgi:hypothetical protein